MKRLSLLGVTALALLSVRFLPAQTAYSLAPVEFGMELRTPDGRPALQYVTRKPTDPNLQSDSVGFLYPILTPKGVPAVELAPQDHRHHRGVFLAWHSMTTSVSRADFWGWGEWAPVENRVIRSEGMQLVETDEKHALLEAAMSGWPAELSIWTRRSAYAWKSSGEPTSSILITGSFQRWRSHWTKRLSAASVCGPAKAEIQRFRVLPA